MPDFAGNQSIKEITKISPGVACLLLLPLSLFPVFFVLPFFAIVGKVKRKTS